MNAKVRAAELYKEHIALASTDGRLFRKTVMDTLMAETGCTIAAAATHYNHAKKGTPVEGLGRAPVPEGVRKPKGKSKHEELQPESHCFTVIELVNDGTDITVGRCQTFLMQGDASETFDYRTTNWPRCNWVMIQGIGPNHGESYKLDPDEREIKSYAPKELSVIA